jgi:hypothetical protein
VHKTFELVGLRACLGNVTFKVKEFFSNFFSKMPFGPLCRVKMLKEVFLEFLIKYVSVF